MQEGAFRVTRTRVYKLRTTGPHRKLRSNKGKTYAGDGKTQFGMGGQKGRGKFSCGISQDHRRQMSWKDFLGE